MDKMQVLIVIIAFLVGLITGIGTFLYVFLKYSLNRRRVGRRYYTEEED